MDSWIYKHDPSAATDKSTPDTILGTPNHPNTRMQTTAPAFPGCATQDNEKNKSRPYMVITFVILVHRWELCEKDLPQRQQGNNKTRLKKHGNITKTDHRNI